MLLIKLVKAILPEAEATRVTMVMKPILPEAAAIRMTMVGDDC